MCTHVEASEVLAVAVKGVVVELDELLWLDERQRRWSVGRWAPEGTPDEQQANSRLCGAETLGRDVTCR